MLVPGNKLNLHEGDNVQFLLKLFIQLYVFLLK